MLISCDGHLFFDPGYHLFFGGKGGRHPYLDHAFCGSKPPLSVSYT